MDFQIDKIYNEDCLVGMQRIPDGMVDAIITDLPYGVLNSQSEGGQWDSIIPLEPMWEQFKRVTKPNAAIVLFGQGMFTAKLMMSQPKMWRYNLIWDKDRKSGFLNANRMPLRRHEDIVVFYQELPTYNPQMEKVAPHRRNHTRGDMKGQLKNRCYGGFVATPTIISDEKYPTSIIYIQREHDVKQFFHPTQKPVDLLRYLVLTYSNEGGNFGCHNRKWDHSGGVHQGAQALYRLRDQQRVLRTSAAAHKERNDEPNPILSEK